MSIPDSTDSVPASSFQKTPQIVIGGTIAIDHVKTPEAEATGLLGGSAAYAALAAAFHSPDVELVGIVGRDFPKEHLTMLEARGIALGGVERSEAESFTWSGEYHANMNERTTHRVGLNVLENWKVKVPEGAAGAEIVVLANMSPDNQLEMLEQCNRAAEKPAEAGAPMDGPRFVIADTMDLWIEIANERLHEVLPRLDLLVLNEGEARELARTPSLARAGRMLVEKGPRHVVVKLGEFGALMFSRNGEIFRCGAWPLEEVSDPTGAGDTFLGAMAGYLASQGRGPYDLATLRRAVVEGTILASFTCEAFSTRRLEVLSREEVSDRRETFRAMSVW